MNRILDKAAHLMPEKDKAYIRRKGATVTFDIQNGPVGENGVNGMQINKLITFTRRVLEQLNDQFPSRENSLTITKLEEAEHWQDARTIDRTIRGVEGHNKA